MSGDLTDFLAFHPTPRPPVKEAAPDPGRDAFVEEASSRAYKTPTRGRGSTLHSINKLPWVDKTVCRVGCTEHDHGVGSIFTPDPELDESHVGWTTQHIPLDPNRSKVSHRCVLCWSLEEELVLHDCQVLAIVNG